MQDFSNVLFSVKWMNESINGIDLFDILLCVIDLMVDYISKWCY